MTAQQFIQRKTGYIKSVAGTNPAAAWWGEKELQVIRDLLTYIQRIEAENHRIAKRLAQVNHLYREEIEHSATLTQIAYKICSTPR